MWFFWDLFKWQSYIYASVFKKLCIDSWISISEDNILFNETCSNLIFFIMAWKVSVPLHTKNAILWYLRSDYPKIHNAKFTAIHIYSYSIELYWWSMPSKYQIENDKKVFEEIFWY